LAPGLTARSALDKFAAVQMIDVHLPTTDGRGDQAHALYPSRTRTPALDRPAEAPPATAAAAKDRHSSRQPSQPP